MNIAVKQLDGSLSDLINNIRPEILTRWLKLKSILTIQNMMMLEEMTTKLLCEKTADFEELLTQLLKQHAEVRFYVKEFLPPLSGRPNVVNLAYPTIFM